MSPFFPKHAVVEIHPLPLPGSREAADLAALRHAARDMERHLAACEQAAPEPDLADVLAARVARNAEAMVAAAGVALALCATRLAVDLARTIRQVPETSAE